MMHALFTKTFYPTQRMEVWGTTTVDSEKGVYSTLFCEKLDNSGSKICELPLKQVFHQATPESAGKPNSKYL